MLKLNPYLNFSGNCEEAFNFYSGVFGGELSISRFSDIPEEIPVDPKEASLVMHVSLPLGEGQVLMGSDRPSAMGPVQAGNSLHISLSPDTSEDAHRLFDALSDGGQVTMALEKTFWGAEFGMFTDRFGIQWMVNYELSPDGR